MWVFLFGFLLLGAVNCFETAGESDACSKLCLNNYKNGHKHMMMNMDLVTACDDGCRLFSLTEFTEHLGGQASASSSKDYELSKDRRSCKDECGKIYGGMMADACIFGCEHQSLVGGRQVEIVIDQSSPIYSHAKSTIDGMMERANQIRQNAWNHFGDFFENTKIGSSSSEFDDIFRQFNTDDFDRMVDRVFDNFNQMWNDFHNHDHEHVEFMTPTLKDPWEEDFIRPEPIRPVNVVKTATPDDRADFDERSAHEPSPPTVAYGRYDRDREHANWLSCMMRRARRLSYVTRWLLCFALMLSIAAMLWICASIMRTAPKQRVRRQLEISTITDKQFLHLKKAKEAEAGIKGADVVAGTWDPLVPPASEGGPPPYESPPPSGRLTLKEDENPEKKGEEYEQFKV